MTKKILVIFSLFTFAILWSCGGGDETNKYVANANCSIVPAENTYSKTIKPILDGSCGFAGCHDSQTKADGIILDTYEGAKAIFTESGTALCTINHDGCGENMPQGASKLPAEMLNLLACWVKNKNPQ